MINPNTEKKFLSWLYDKYTRRLGYGVRNIDKCDFCITYSIEDLPDDFYSVSNGVAKSHVHEYAKELEAKGLLRFSENGLVFYFTKAGYDAVSAGRWQRFLDFLNLNPGALALIAALISIGSLVVSIIALKK